MYAQYVARRFGMMLLVVVLAVSINFLLPRLMPGDPVEAQLNQLLATGGGGGDISAMVDAYRARFGLDQPLLAQYFSYWRSVFSLDLGVSLAAYPERVSHAILAGLPWTLGLLGFATLVSFVLGTWLGGLLGWPRTPRIARAFGSGLILFSSVPYFLIGMVLLYLFAIVFRWFPAGGGMPFGQSAGFNWQTLTAIAWHGTLPAASIILAEIGAWALGMRGMMVSVLGEDYITLAEAKGLKPRRIFRWYGLRNALLPQLTKLAMTLGHIVSGAILVEVIFSYPGIGFRLYQAIQANDYFVIQGIVLLLSVSIAIAMFILDLAYPLIDPRITTGRE
ncbi:ABC transporter permease [Chelatococcus asaccharovorans]|uniref:Peptide/nickel transport system permease protein n=1 Tax=Chelatococcus asaccharovorans TaxID=28210 RepID=A0A2V3UEC7_9HYPH|nr:ABC transporter permease [Chelatococcus asaccharovorans]MBS7706912.1 ABC transporter permease [Chelatococcus asaccharovorans]PXW63091.1 peptide/nickel transport system permease protein [Chelatococcus asaccharovorans]CAH1654075.1 Peptide/nickel transport system permease protein [Chelatococcus asaccharovorans]CAH1694489.1 Peptide/nickel transport system permease protein [Chelatococcus asaccharovorans]